jgi:hypothetical protein
VNVVEGEADKTGSRISRATKMIFDEDRKAALGIVSFFLLG